MAYNEVMLLIVKNVRYIGKYKSEKNTETVQSDISIPVQPKYKNTVLPIDDGTEKKPDVSYRYNEEHNSWDEVYSLENVSMIYDTADNEIYLEFGDSHEKVSWVIQRLGGGG